MQGQAQQQPLSLSAQAGARLATDAPQLAARITNAFGQGASDALAASGDAAASPDVDLLTLAPQSQRLGAAASPAANSPTAAVNRGAPVPAPAPAATHTTKFTTEIAAQGPLTSAAAAHSPEHPPLGLPKPPLHEFFDLPGELGLLPALPGQLPLLPGPGLHNL